MTNWYFFCGCHDNVVGPTMTAMANALRVPLRSSRRYIQVGRWTARLAGMLRVPSNVILVVRCNGIPTSTVCTDWNAGVSHVLALVKVAFPIVYHELTWLKARPIRFVSVQIPFIRDSAVPLGLCGINSSLWRRATAQRV